MCNCIYVMCIASKCILIFCENLYLEFIAPGLSCHFNFIIGTLQCSLVTIFWMTENEQASLMKIKRHTKILVSWAFEMVTFSICWFQKKCTSFFSSNPTVTPYKYSIYIKWLSRLSRINHIPLETVHFINPFLFFFTRCLSWVQPSSLIGRGNCCENRALMNTVWMGYEQHIR